MRSFFLPLALLLSASAVLAQGLDICFSSRVLPAIARNDKATALPEEAVIKNHPSILNAISMDATATPALANPDYGGHPLLIFRNKEAPPRVGFISYAELDLPPGTAPGALPETDYLVTHRVLFNALEQKLGPGNFEIIAAGEYWGRNKEIYKITNRSSTFPGGQEQLDFITSYLKSSGARLSPNFRTEEWRSLVAQSNGKPIKDGHLARADRIRVFMKMRNSQELKTIMSLDQWLHEKFPAPNDPGKFNDTAVGDLIFARLFKLYEKPTPTPEEQQLSADLTFIGQWLDNLREDPLLALSIYTNKKTTPGTPSLERISSLIRDCKP